jgi:hypothetical protein
VVIKIKMAQRFLLTRSLFTPRFPFALLTQPRFNFSTEQSKELSHT